MKLKQAIEINTALRFAAQVDFSKTIEGREVNFKIALNIKNLKYHINDYNEEFAILIDSYAKKDEKGNYIIIGEEFDFGDAKSEYKEKYKALMEKEIDFTPLTILRNSETDKIQGDYLADLLDVIIIEKES